MNRGEKRKAHCTCDRAKSGEGRVEYNWCEEAIVARIGTEWEEIESGKRKTGEEELREMN